MSTPQLEQLEQDDLTLHFMELEAVLTIHELMLMVKLAAILQEQDIREPIGMVLAEKPDLELWRAPLLEEDTLLRMAQQKRLIRLGLIQMDQEGTLSLTGKGMQATKWWLGFLQDIQSGAS